MSTLGKAVLSTFWHLKGKWSTGWGKAHQRLGFSSITLFLYDSWHGDLPLPCQACLELWKNENLASPHWVRGGRSLVSRSQCVSIAAPFKQGKCLRNYYYAIFSRCEDVNKQIFTRIFLFNEKILHLVDDIFWLMGFNRAEHAEKPRWRVKLFKMLILIIVIIVIIFMISGQNRPWL